MPLLAVRVARCVYYNQEKLIHPYHLIVTRNKVTFSRVFATLEEAEVGRDTFLTNLGQKTSSQLLCEKTADAL
jgi:hypothetical protein